MRSGVGMDIFEIDLGWILGGYWVFYLVDSHFLLPQWPQLSSQLSVCQLGWIRGGFGVDLGGFVWVFGGFAIFVSPIGFSFPRNSLSAQS